MDKFLEALDKLLQTCNQFFGPYWTLFLIIAVPIGLFLFRWYKDHQKAKEISEVVKAKDETIQILAEHNRELRVIILKTQGWTEEAIEQIVMKNRPKDSLEAREMLEKGGKTARRLPVAGERKTSGGHQSGQRKAK